MPKGRMPIKTIVKKDTEITEVLELMYEELKNKHQIYVIAPLIDVLRHVFQKGDRQIDITEGIRLAE